MAHSTEESMVFLLVRFFIASFAIAGNLVIVLTILRSPRLVGRAYNVLIVQLALSDCIVGVGLFVRVVSTSVQNLHYPLEDFSEVYCVSVASVSVLGIELSQLSVLTIAVDRLSAVKYPISYKNKDPFWYPLRCFLFAFFIALIGVAMLFFGVDVGNRTPVCTLSAHDVKVFAPYWILFSTVVTTLIFVSYGITLSVLRGADGLQQRKASLQMESARELARQTKVFITISVVLLSYFVCYVLPFIAHVIGLVARAPDEILSVLVLVNGLSSGINAAINILLYGWKYDELRVAMIRFVKGEGKKRCNGGEIESLGGTLRRKPTTSSNTKAVLIYENAEGDVLL